AWCNQPSCWPTAHNPGEAYQVNKGCYSCSPSTWGYKHESWQTRSVISRAILDAARNYLAELRRAAGDAARRPGRIAAQITQMARQVSGIVAGVMAQALPHGCGSLLSCLKNNVGSIMVESAGCNPFYDHWCPLDEKVTNALGAVVDYVKGHVGISY